MVGENTCYITKEVDCDRHVFALLITDSFPILTLLFRNWLFANNIFKDAFVNCPLARYGKWDAMI